MANQTAFYNLTKPVATETYNLDVWNTNMDMIDAQMHQNATEAFTGATELADGTVGNVPAPTSADREKYLRGDGTWHTVSGGGGGGASELADLDDVNISSPTDGQGLVYDATNDEWVNGAVSGDITDFDFSNMTSSQTSDIMTKLNSGEGETHTGSFTTGSTQYEKIEVVCGFKPDYIRVELPFSASNVTVATYDASVSTTTSTWYIPGESRTYTITLGSATGETGITDITDTGFKFRCNAGNTRNVQCTYSASVGGDTYIQTVDFTQLKASQIADLKTALGIS